MPPSKKRPRLSPKQIRIRELEREAARRTLYGTGMNGSLPPLPFSGHGDDTIDEGEEDRGDGAGIGTLFGHPYGALPYGKFLFAASASIV